MFVDEGIDSLDSGDLTSNAGLIVKSENPIWDSLFIILAIIAVIILILIIK